MKENRKSAELLDAFLRKTTNKINVKEGDVCSFELVYIITYSVRIVNVF